MTTAKLSWPTALVWTFLPCFLAWADGPQDNIPEKVRRIPPPGIKIPAEIARELGAGVEALGKEIDDLRQVLEKKPRLLDLLPDVQIFHNAVRYALKYDEFYKEGEFSAARRFLQQGMERAQHLRNGQAPWTTATGLVVRGYVSRIDGSVQPYGLVVPGSYRPDAPHQHRLDIWFHGRGEQLSEVTFLDSRQKSPGEFTPPHAFVLHPYGRYSNANHFAGEVDTFEAMVHVRRHYPIDPDRIVVRGFSMGGAACWHFAVHHAGLWAAAAPGAGFSETPDFLRTFQGETLQPSWFEQKLWHLYDCTDWALNLYHCPVVAYSGTKDKQKQAADIMAKAMAGEGLNLTHILGLDTGHSYHPAAKDEINRRIDSIVNLGRQFPRRVRFTTWTLRYNQMHWVTVDALEEHWERCRIEAEVLDDTTIKATTSKVAGLTLDFPAGHCPLDSTRSVRVILDGQELRGARVASDRSWTAHFHKKGKTWLPSPVPENGALRKRHGLQGPIDDAFMDRFIMVRPTGKPHHDKVGQWVTTELEHAVMHWRQQFRGEAIVKNDADLSSTDIATSNLILWGDPSSNKVLSEIAGKLPIVWNGTEVKVGRHSFAAEHHVPVLVYPNPLNPKKYVVLNSGFTFREYDYLNNARQVPKLPDWTILDLRQPPTSQRPAGIAAAGFFGEAWELRRDR